MLHNIFDSHAHYDDGAFDEDRSSLLERLPEEGVSHVVNCGSDLASSRAGVDMTWQYSHVYAAVGIHPHEAAKARPEDLDALKTLLSLDKVVAVGEIGLDYHYDFSPRETQLFWFETQIHLAKELDMPIVVHDREAHGDTLELLRRYRPKGVVHCFSGSVEMAREIVKLGMSIGLGGAVTFKNAKKPVAVASSLPLEHLVLETDAPYMTPMPFRGRRCDSTFIRYTAETIAALRGMETQQLLDATQQNAMRLFGLQE